MKIRHVDFYPDEFLVGVVGLNPAEIGAYWIACSLMYSRGGPIPEDDTWIARACGCHIRTWRTIKERLIAAGKLVLGDGFIANSRVLREIEKTQRRLKQSRDAAEKSAKERRESVEKEGQRNDINGLDGAPARISDEPTINHQPSTNQPSTFLTDGTPSPGKALWDEGVAYLMGHGNAEKAARSCIGKWRKEFGDERTHAGVRAAREQNISEPVAWIFEWLKAPRNAAPPRTAEQALAQLDGWKGLAG